jgi:hypothetical protein
MNSNEGQVDNATHEPPAKKRWSTPVLFNYGQMTASTRTTSNGG